MNEVRIDLPWTSPPLRDNDRGNWAAKHRKVAAARRLAATLAHYEKVPRGLERVAIILHWQPATRRHRDQLSIAPTLKPLVDGLVDYGLVPDDDIEHVQVSCRIYEAQRGVAAACWLTIEPLAAGEAK